MNISNNDNNNNISSPLKTSISTDATDRWSALRAVVSSSNIDTPRMLSQQDFNRHQFASMKANVLTQLPKGKLYQSSSSSSLRHHNIIIVITIIVIIT